MLKTKTIWWLGLLLTALLATPLVLRVPNPYNSFLLNEVHEALHTVLFFVTNLIMLLMARYAFKVHSVWRLMLGVSLFNLAIGGAIEIIQPSLGRSGSWEDMLRNSFGVLMGGAAFCVLVFRRYPFKPLLALAMASLFAIAAFWTLFGAAWREYVRNRDFPVLMNFDVPITRSYVTRANGAKIKMMAAPEGWLDNTSHTLKVWMPPNPKWAGFIIHNPVLRWDGYHKLTFQVFSNLKHTVKLASNLYSAENSGKLVRYKAYVIRPGINHLEWDLTEGTPLKNHHITRVSWYTIEEKQAITLYFDNFRLQ